MSVEHVEVLVEERSMAAALTLLLPRILRTTTWEIHEHRSKRDLLDRLPARLHGYRAWLPARWRVLVIIDRDEEECHELKDRLERMAAGANLVTRSAAKNKSFSVVNRIAVEELEAWYFGDWEAVRASYPRVPATIPSNRKYRDPDAISGGTWEALERVLQRAGYFKGGLAKIEAARAIAPNMSPERNTSKSFGALFAALAEMASQ